MNSVAFDHSLKGTEMHTHNKAVCYSCNYAMPIYAVKKIKKNVYYTCWNYEEQSEKHVEQHQLVSFPLSSTDKTQDSNTSKRKSKLTAGTFFFSISITFLISDVHLF